MPVPQTAPTAPLKLQWHEQYGFHSAHAVNSAVSVVIRRADQWHQDAYFAWEIVIGCFYWSRDKKKYFSDVEIAKQQAEVLLKAVANKLLKELE